MDEPSKEEMIDFINEHLVDLNNELTPFTPLSEIRAKLQAVKASREEELHPDEWSDDEILEQAQDYIDFLTNERINNESPISISRGPEVGGMIKKRRYKRVSKKNKRKASKKRKSRKNKKRTRKHRRK